MQNPPREVTPINGSVRGRINVMSHSRRFGRTTVILLLLVATSLATGAILWQAARALATLRWQPVPCAMMRSNLIEHRGLYRPAVSFAYEIDGKDYVGRRYSLLAVRYGWRTSLPPSESSATCYVNPRDPSQAVLKRGLNLVDALFVGAAGVFFVISATCAIGIAIDAWRSFKVAR